MKVSVVGGLVIAAPIILHQIWLFVKPALTVREKQLSNWILPVAIGLFGIGIVFSYFLVLPAAVKFFMGFATDDLQPMFSIGQYMDFVIILVLPFGFIFELPLILIILGYFNLITSRFFKNEAKDIYSYILYHRCCHFTYTGYVLSNDDCITYDIAI